MNTKMIDDLVKQMTVSKVAICLAIVVIAVCINRILKAGFRKLRTKSDFSESSPLKATVMVIYNVLRISIIAVAVLFILQTFGVDVTSFIAGLGLFSAIIALALQDVLKDVFSGVVILVDNYYRVDDAVEYNGKDGIVISFNVRTTKIQYIDDNSVMSVSNRNISQIRKLTRLVDIDLPLSYEEDPRKVYKVLGEMCERAKQLENVEDCQFKGTQNFEDSAITYKIRFFCPPNKRPDTRRAMIKLIQDTLLEENITIPYQQMDIHTKS